MATKAEKKQKKIQANEKELQDIFEGKVWPPHIDKMQIVPREAIKGRIRCNHKDWEPILEKFPLVHSIQYKKDKMGKIARIRHVYFSDEVHIPKLIFEEFRQFFDAVGFVLVQIDPEGYGYQAYGIERKK